MSTPLEIFNALPSYQLVYIIKDCKELLRDDRCPQRRRVEYTLKALRNIMIERETLRQ